MLGILPVIIENNRQFGAIPHGPIAFVDTNIVESAQGHFVVVDMFTAATSLMGVNGCFFVMDVWLLPIPCMGERAT